MVDEIHFFPAARNKSILALFGQGFKQRKGPQRQNTSSN